MSDRLIPLSDSQIVWDGERRIARVPDKVFPRVWASAHEAALGVAETALDLLAAPLEGIADTAEQRKLAAELLKQNWRALEITSDQTASWQERIRRERAKLVADPPKEEWSEARSPAAWQKMLGLSETTYRRHIKEGKILVRKISSKSVQIRMDVVEKYLGTK